MSLFASWCESLACANKKSEWLSPQQQPRKGEGQQTTCGRFDDEDPWMVDQSHESSAPAPSGDKCAKLLPIPTLAALLLLIFNSISYPQQTFLIGHNLCGRLAGGSSNADWNWSNIAAKFCIWSDCFDHGFPPPIARVGAMLKNHETFGGSDSVWQLE